jgi:succinate dehydrogenase / fumarate reductase cytochrome b subunit
MTSRARPLSPHMSIYRPQVTSVLSILHRATGVYMFFFIVFSLLTLFSFINSETVMEYKKCDSVLWSYFLTITVFGFILCLSYHLCAGIRYLFWTCNVGINMVSVRYSAAMVGLGTVILTISSMYLYLSEFMKM